VGEPSEGSKAKGEPESVAVAKTCKAIVVYPCV